MPDEGGFPFGGEAGGDEGLREEDLAAAAILAFAARDPELKALLPEDPSEAATRLAEVGEVLLEAPAALLSALGVYRYTCGDPWATPYEREAAVSRPLTLQDLPAPLRERFRPGLLPLSFVESPRIAPGEHGPVSAWGEVWQDTRGAVHPTSEGKPTDEELESARQDGSEAGPSLVDGTQPLTLPQVRDLVREALKAAPPPRPAARPGGGGLLGWLRKLLGA